MQIYGYCGVAAKQQSIDRQENNIKAAYPSAVILREEFTGAKEGNREGDRPKLEMICSKVKAGDMIVFDSVTRMSENAEECFHLYEDLFNKGIELVFLKEPHINTATYKKALQDRGPKTGAHAGAVLEGVSRYLTALAREQIRIAFEQTEKETDELRRRTKEGIETARLNGKQIGQKRGAKLTTRKSVEAKELIRANSKDFEGSLPDAECMKLAGLARNTFYKYKKELRQEISETGEA
jgi:DNA invertase Pin-like site-specific DNA recombinase